MSRGNHLSAGWRVNDSAPKSVGLGISRTLPILVFRDRGQVETHSIWVPSIIVLPSSSMSRTTDRRLRAGAPKRTTYGVQTLKRIG